MPYQARIAVTNGEDWGNYLRLRVTGELAVGSESAWIPGRAVRKHRAAHELPDFYGEKIRLVDWRTEARLSGPIAGDRGRNPSSLAEPLVSDRVAVPDKGCYRQRSSAGPTESTSTTIRIRPEPRLTATAGRLSHRVVSARVLTDSFLRARSRASDATIHQGSS